jgi:hypothetical protein
LSVTGPEEAAMDAASEADRSERATGLQDGMVAPTPVRTHPRPRAARNLGPDASLGLVDSMLNPAAGWGRGILDAVDEAASARWPHISTDRIARPQLGLHEPDRWAEAMVARHAAIVIAVGD